MAARKAAQTRDMRQRVCGEVIQLARELKALPQAEWTQESWDSLIMARNFLRGAMKDAKR